MESYWSHGGLSEADPETPELAGAGFEPATFGLSGRGLAVTSTGERDDAEPELVDRMDHLVQPVEVHRLADVGVHVQVVGELDVAFGRRGAHDDHREPAQIGIRL